jgi:hypothetical protein
VTRGAASVRAARRAEPRPEEQLALLEFLLACEDPARWRAGVSSGSPSTPACGKATAWPRHRANRLVHVAAFGVQPVTVNGFGIDLEAHDHPLVQALSVTRPVVMAPRPRAGSSRDARPSWPCPSTARTSGAGAGRPPPHPSRCTANATDLEWVAEYLGYRLVRARLRSPAPRTSDDFAGIGTSCGASWIG